MGLHREPVCINIIYSCESWGRYPGTRMIRLRLNWSYQVPFQNSFYEIVVDVKVFFYAF